MTLIKCACGCGTLIEDKDNFGLPCLHVVELVECACGCGQLRPKRDKRGRRRRYIQGHGLRGKQLTEEHREKLSKSHKGIPGIVGRNHYNYGKHLSEETRKKLSEAHKGKAHPLSEAACIKISNSLRGRFCGEKNPFFGKRHTEKTRKIISEKQKGVRIGEKNHNYGKTVSEERRAKISESLKGKQAGEKNPMWKGGISFEPYCYNFNFKLKEKIRDKFNRVCFICGKLEEENGRRLDIHHIDGDKMQGCNGKDWLLVPLCRSCHSKIQHNEEYWNVSIQTKVEKLGGENGIL